MAQWEVVASICSCSCVLESGINVLFSRFCFPFSRASPSVTLSPSDLHAAAAVNLHQREQGSAAAEQSLALDYQPLPRREKTPEELRVETLARQLVGSAVGRNK